MKKLLLLFILISIVGLSGCKKTSKIPLEDIYGKYYYKECLYISNFGSSSKEDETKNHKDIVRYAVEEKNYFYYATESNDATISLRSITYEEKDILDGIDSTDSVKSILKKMTTRYDVIKNGVNQGYCFLSNGDKTYFMEIRNIGNTKIVYQIIEIKK